MKHEVNERHLTNEMSALLGCHYY